MKVGDLSSQSLQIFLVFLVARHVKRLALLVDPVLNHANLLRDDRFDDEENLAEANGVLQLGHQVFILLCHVLDLLAELLLDANEVSQLRLQSIHLHVLDLLILFIELALHLTYLFQSLLLFEVSVHVLTISIGHVRVDLLFDRHLLVVVRSVIHGRTRLDSVLMDQRVRDNHVIAHNYVLVNCHGSTMKVILQTILDVLAVLLYLGEVVGFILALHFEVALNYLIDLFAIQTIDQHAVLEGVLPQILDYRSQLANRVQRQLYPLVVVQLLELHLEVLSEVLAQLRPVSLLGLILLILLPVCQIVPHVLGLVGGDLSFEPILV